MEGLIKLYNMCSIIMVGSIPALLLVPRLKVCHFFKCNFVTSVRVIKLGSTLHKPLILAPLEGF